MTAKIYTAAQMRAREQAAVDAGATFLQLMERAGQAAAADMLQRFPQAGRVLVVCGKGNNGGDGLVVARVLQQHGRQCDVLPLPGGTWSDLAETNRQRLSEIPQLRFIGQPDLAEQLRHGYDLVVDAVFGTGFNGALPSPVRECCRLLNAAGGHKAALDLPSGLNADSGQADADSFCADVTYAFAAYKPGHFSEAGRRLCGEVVCLDIGIG